MRPCPACRDTSARHIGAAHGFEVVRCKSCGTLFSAVLPGTPEQAEDYAAYYDEWNLQVPDFVERRLDRLVAGFARYRDRNRWLDVGCGAGTLLRAASKRGWTAVGTEVAAGAANAVRSQGLDVRLGELADLDLEPGSFDVVSVVEVLEHLPDPGRLVESAAELVRQGGVVYVTTPHARGISARLLRTRWSVISPPEHLQIFSTSGLKTLLNETGLDLTRLRTDAVNPRELLAALRRGGDDEMGGRDRVATGYELNEALSTNPAGRIAKAAINSSLNALRLGDALKATARKPD